MGFEAQKFLIYIHKVWYFSLWHYQNWRVPNLNTILRTLSSIWELYMNGIKCNHFSENNKCFASFWNHNSRYLFISLKCFYVQKPGAYWKTDSDIFVSAVNRQAIEFFLLSNLLDWYWDKRPPWVINSSQYCLTFITVTRDHASV